jgi:hypothetical protein
MLLWFNILKPSSQENAFALARSLRFYNKSFVPFGSYLCLKFFIVRWQHIGLWEEVVIIRKPFHHAHQMSAETILSSQIIHTWEVICSLVRPHFLKKFNGYRTIKPCNIPFTLIIFSEVIIEYSLANFLDHIILSPGSIHY